jgi:hypothetical protein
MTDTLRLKLADFEYEIPPLNLRQHRAIDLTNLRPIPPPNKEDHRQAREDAYERMADVVCAALSVKYPEMTRDKLDELPIDGLELTRAYELVEQFAGYTRVKDSPAGEPPASPDAPPA